MATGSCNCGAVAFEINEPVQDVFVCHCSICRRSTGSAGIAVVLARHEDFRWVRGEQEIRGWSKPGHDWHTNFCAVCGSRLPDRNSDSLMYIPAGLIDTGGEKLHVAHHIWVGSKACWDEIGDDGVQHATAFDPQRA